MSSGFDWVKARASNPETSMLADRDWSYAAEWPSETFFHNFLNPSRVVIGDKEYLVRLSFDPDSQFAYFASASIISDGTLSFDLNMMHRLAERVVTLQTADKTKLDLDFSEVHWTIGNFALLQEHCRIFAPKGKPWMQTRATVLLPLRMDVK